MKFAIEKLDDGTLRFTSPEGWVDLRADGKRATLEVGTYNGTSPTKFGSTLWALLKDTMPELGLEVVSLETPRNDHLEAICYGAGMRQDGIRRKWGADGQDLACYSILAEEVRFEVKDKEPENGEHLPAG